MIREALLGVFNCGIILCCRLVMATLFYVLRAKNCEHICEAERLPGLDIG